MQESPENPADGERQVKIEGKEPGIGVGAAEKLSQQTGEGEDADENADAGDNERDQFDFCDLRVIEVVAVNGDISG